MEIMQVDQSLVCTRRIPGLHDISLRVLRDRNDAIHVAVDPVGCRQGNWVFTSSGSAARYAADDFSVLTDLTVCGIIDFWKPDESQATREGCGKTA